MILNKKIRYRIAMLTFVYLFITVFAMNSFENYLKHDVVFIFNCLSIVYSIFFLIKDVVLKWRYKIKTNTGSVYLVKNYETLANGHIRFKTIFIRSQIELTDCEIIDCDGE